MRPGKPANLADVAARAAVDPSTASRVLSGRADQRVSEATRARILEAAASLEYRPNALARGLRLSRTRTLGIVVAQLENPLYAEIVAGAAEAVRAEGYTLLIVHQGEGETDYRRLADVNRIDGLIVATLAPDEVLASELAGFDVPTVVLHRKIGGIANCITIDSFGAVKQCIEHLIGLGHRRIGYLARVSGYYNDAQRLAGYRAAHAEAGIAVDDDLIIHTPHTRAQAEETIRALLEEGWRLPTAIFNVTLIASAGIMSVLAERGIRVPGDLSVLSLYDNPFADVLQPPVTTMRMPLRQLGAAGAGLLIDLLEKRPANGPHMLAPGPIVVRRSTGAPRLS